MTEATSAGIEDPGGHERAARRVSARTLRIVSSVLMVVLVLAVVANLIAQHAAGAAAFWLRDAGSAWFLYLKAVFILGGMIIPLELLPHALQRVALILPFRAMAYAPARLASGHVEPELLLQQVAWIVVLMVFAARVFAAGERRLQVVGG